MEKDKYRVWYDKSQSWVYFVVGQTFSEEGLKVYNDVCVSGNKFYKFTGLTDCNGKEIYDGDVVKIHEGHFLNAVVSWFDDLTWDSGGSSHPGFYCKEWLENDELDYHSGFYNVIVIGNIYENPELIQEFDDN